MSGVVKGVKKVFKAVGKVVKKIAKPLAIAAAVYFTGGLALSAFPATQAFAASLPGFGISSTGAATGVFSKAASALGMSGGLKAGAGVSTIGPPAATSVAGGIAGSAPVGGMGPPVSLAGAAPAAKAGMSLTEKLLLASMGSKAIGAFMAPTLEQQFTERVKFRGAYYGTYFDGTGQDVSQPPSAGTPQQVAQEAQPVGQPPPSVGQDREIMPTRKTEQTVAEAPAAPSVDRQQPPSTPVENAPIESKQLMQENVRYV